MVVYLIETTLLAAGPRIENQDLHRLVRPFPIADFGQVIAVFVNVLLVLGEPDAQVVLEMCADLLQARHTIDSVSGEMKAVEFVQHSHIEGRCDSSLFFVAVDMKISMVFAA